MTINALLTAVVAARDALRTSFAETGDNFMVATVASTAATFSFANAVASRPPAPSTPPPESAPTGACALLLDLAAGMAPTTRTCATKARAEAARARPEARPPARPLEAPVVPA